MIPDSIVVPVLRQALSMDLRPGTKEFDNLIVSRLWEPYAKHVKYPHNGSDKKEIFMAGCDQRMVQMFWLEYFYRHCRANKGLTVDIVGRQIGYDAKYVVHFGALCVDLMVTPDNPVQKYLDGADTMYDPDHGENISPNGRMVK
jgi:hypothetical protein